MAKKSGVMDKSHKRIEVGTFEKGFFIPYGSNRKVRSKLDPNSDWRAKMASQEQEYANRRIEIHGSFKDGVFRPAEKSDRPGYIHTYTTPSGETYSFDWDGSLNETRTSLGLNVG